MRLIDADALSKRMYHDAFETESDMQKWDSGCWIRYKMFERAIDDAPTVEPEHKTGRWIRWTVATEDETGIEYTPHCKCSECGTEYDPHSSKFVRFCHVCGTRMEEQDALD